MEIAGLLSMLPPELLPIGIFALIALYIFKGAAPYFRKADKKPEDSNKAGPVG
ncbi:hypothetical protein [Arthrobacter alpinus]|uniref:hypothetical protein n=1 Tax=Arthrobacter alpinus TaxID=656366 RepID=UPI0016493968|nr:hypothetical protein [Arthrobacter alpinus]